MGQWFSSQATQASRTLGASQPRKRYGRLKRMQCWSATGEGTVEVVEWCGAYKRTMGPGLHCLWGCLGQSAVGRLSTALQHQEVQVECKTADGVFVELVFTVMYRVAEDRHYEAYYSLADPQSQVTSYVLDAVNKGVAGVEVERLFADRDGLIESVRHGLHGVLHSHGFTLEDCLITVMTPTPTVKEAMSAVLASKRARESAFEQGEAEKLRTVQNAEGSAESKYLQGQGLARFFIALAAGTRESLKVLVTGRLKPEELAFPQPPPADARGALEAAGVANLDSLPAELGGSGGARQGEGEDGGSGRRGGAAAGKPSQPWQASSKPPHPAAVQRGAPAVALGQASSAGLTTPLLGKDGGERLAKAKLAVALPPPPLLAPQAPPTPTRHVHVRAVGEGAAGMRG